MAEGHDEKAALAPLGRDLAAFAQDGAAAATLEGGRRQVEPAVRRVQQRLLEPLTPADRTTMPGLSLQLAAVHSDVTPAPRLAAYPS